MRLAGVLLLPVLLASGLPAVRSEEAPPALVIVSRLGAGADARLFNDEPIVFLARVEGDPAGAFRRGVVFHLLEPGGRPDRSETVIACVEDGKLWGRPPSRFALPLEGTRLEPGSYRLRADAPGHRHAEIGVRIARIAPTGLEVRHEADRYAASFRLRLVDPAETRPSVPVRLLVTGAAGETIDEIDGALAGGRKEGVFESTVPIVLSSRAEAGAGPGPRPLKVAPGCSFVVRMGELRFSWPVPLPPEEARETSKSPRKL